MTTATKIPRNRHVVASCRHCNDFQAVRLWSLIGKDGGSVFKVWQAG
jgi:hypothetical protein